MNTCKHGGCGRISVNGTSCQKHVNVQVHGNVPTKVLRVNEPEHDELTSYYCHEHQCMTTVLKFGDYCSRHEHQCLGKSCSNRVSTIDGCCSNDCYVTRTKIPKPVHMTPPKPNVPTKEVDTPTVTDDNQTIHIQSDDSHLNISELVTMFAENGFNLNVVTAGNAFTLKAVKSWDK